MKLTVLLCILFLSIKQSFLLVDKFCVNNDENCITNRSFIPLKNIKSSFKTIRVETKEKGFKKDNDNKITPHLYLFFKDMINSFLESSIKECKNYYYGFIDLLNIYSLIFNGKNIGNKNFKKRLLVNTNYRNISKYNNNSDDNSNKAYNEEMIYFTRISNKKLYSTLAHNHNNSLKKLKELRNSKNNDFRNNTECIYSPFFESKLTKYICNNETVTNQKYIELKNRSSIFCETFTYYDNICLCPITSKQCTEKQENIYCKVTNFSSNGINLMTGVNSFYKEYDNHKPLNYSDGLLKFNLSFDCYTESKSSTLKNKNYYLFLDNKIDFDILSTQYPKDFKQEQKQYLKEDILLNNPKIFEYYYTDDKIILYKEMKLFMTFSIYDMNWILPKRTITFPIPVNKVAYILSGKESFTFNVDLKNLLEYEIKEEKFQEKNNEKYKNYSKGDLLFYEITLNSEINNIVFNNLIGTIKK